MQKHNALLVVASALIVGSLANCSCEQQTKKRFPKIEVLDAMGAERTAVDFGQVQLNVTATQQVRVRNSGNVALTVSKVEFSKPALFGITTTLPASIDVNGESDLAFTFTPTQPDIRETGTVTLTSDDPDRPTVTLSLAGTGVTAVAVVQPTALAFGEVYVNESKALGLTLTNTGSNDLVISDARFTAATPASITGNLAPLKTTLKAGESASTMVTFAPTAPDAVAAAIEIVLPAALGTKTVPITAQGIKAVPRLCFKYDDSPMENCTDETLTFLSLNVGSFCDARIYPPDGGPSPCRGLDGGAVGYARAAKLYFRNEGNTPVSYTLQYQSQVGNVCDAGSAIDFEFANAPLQADGGRQASWNVPTVKLPTSVMDPKPWETAPIAVTYRARSACREDAADQARVLFTRQGEPAGTMRTPQTLILNLTGQSVLPRGVPQDIVMNGTVPLTVDFLGVGNAGEAPLRVTQVSLWQAEFLLDGGRSTTPYELCDPMSTGDCRFFHWAPGNDPNTTLPRSLAGTPNVSVPTREILGRIVFGAALDGGVAPLTNREYGVYAVIDTNDPYAPQVIARVRGTAR